MYDAMAHDPYVNGWIEVLLDTELGRPGNSGFVPLTGSIPARSMPNLRLVDDDYGYLEISEEMKGANVTNNR